MTPSIRSRRNPYVGPRALQHGEKLYGRDLEVRELFNLLVAERIVLLYAPSGAGKTSLIQASLIDDLRTEGFRVLPIMRINQELLITNQLPTPKNRYVLSALLSLEEHFPADQRLPISALGTMNFSAYLDARWPSQQPHAEEVNGSGAVDDSSAVESHDVLIFDQFEEIVLVDPVDHETKVAFFTQLGAALRKRTRWAIFSIREDYVPRIEHFLRPIPTQCNTRFRLDFLDTLHAKLAMQEPARLVGIDFTETAASKLVNDLCRVRVQQIDGSVHEVLGLHVEPVQLQVVCRRLYNELPDNATAIKEADVDKLGNVDDALANYYAESVEAIAEQTKVPEREIRKWFDKRLITEQGLRGQVLQGRNQTEGLANEAIQLLVNEHLVRSQERHGSIWFELAHDRLIEPISQNNSEWREKNLSVLQQQADLWHSGGRREELLLHGPLLKEAERWVINDKPELTTIEDEYLKACREARKNAYWARVRRYVIAVLVVIFIMGAMYIWTLNGSVKAIQAAQATVVMANQTAVAARSTAVAARSTAEAAAQNKAAQAALAQRAEATAVGARDEAIKSARLATARQFITAAISNLETDPEPSLLLAVQAVLTTYNADQTVLPEAEDALRQALLAARAERTLVGHGNAVTAVVLSPDGRRIATGSSDQTAKIWNAATGQLEHTLADHNDPVTAVAFSADSRRIATASTDRTAKIWNVANGQLERTFSDHDSPVTAVAFSPDGTLLATGTATLVKLWDSSNGLAVGTLGNHEREVTSVAFSPDGTLLASTSADTNVRLWEISSNRLVRTLSGHARELTSVTFSPDGTQLASASIDKTVKLWEVTSGRPTLTISGHTAAVTSVTFSADGTRLATGSRDRTAKVWNSDSGTELFTLDGHGNAVTSIAFYPDGSRLATASADQSIKVWSTGPTREVLTIVGHAGPVNRLVYSPDGSRIATASSDTTARVWDAASGVLVFPPLPHTDVVNSVIYSRDGSRLLTASRDGSAKIWDARTGQEILTLGEQTDAINDAMYSPDGKRIATASSNGRMQIWDSQSGKLLINVVAHDGPVISVAFSPDGSRVASAGRDGLARLWNGATGQKLPLFVRHSATINNVVFSPDGLYLATASTDQTIKLWNIASGREEFTLSGHTSPIINITFDPTGTQLASGSWDRTSKLWNIQSREEVRTLVGHSAEVNSVAFSPDGKHLATASVDASVRVYALTIQELLQLARTRVTRSLTKAECDKYLHTASCSTFP